VLFSADRYLAFVPLLTHAHQPIYRLLSLSKAYNPFPEICNSYSVSKTKFPQCLDPSFIFDILTRSYRPNCDYDFIPHLYSAPPQGGDAVGISWMCLMLVKLEWLGYRMVKNYDAKSSDTGTWQTDGRTELLHQYRASVCWRDKNHLFVQLQNSLFKFEFP